MTRLTAPMFALVCALLLLLAIAWFAFHSQEKPLAAGAGSAAGAPPLPLVTVRQGTVEQTVALTGRVGSPAGTQVKLAFALAGTLQSVDVRLGERVAAGAPLARLDATPFSFAASQAQAEAQAAGAGARLASVDRTSVKLRIDAAELARQERLYRAGIVARRDVEAAQALVAADRAESATARLEFEQAQAQSRAADAHASGANYDVGRAVLRAPSAGTVAGIYAAPGQAVDSSVPVVAIASDDQDLATLDVPASQIASIHNGDPVRARTGDARWQGFIGGVAPAVDPTIGLATLTVRGAPPGTPAGTPIDATVVTGQVEGLVVPIDAIVEDPQTGANLVFVRSGDHFTSRTVTVDVRNDRFARVVRGLRPGERIAAQGAIDLLSPAAPDDQ